MRTAFFLALLLGMRPPPAHAEPVITFGGEATCQTWLSRPNDIRYAYSWTLAFWSGLNFQAGLAHQTHDVGHTLTADQVGNAVMALCRQDPSMKVSLAVLSVYTSAAREKR